MAQWQPYIETVSKHTVVGDLRITRDVISPQLGNQRDITVWLPPSYETSERRYPVIYMHDGQNLFDAVPSYAGEWQVDEAMMALSSEGIEAIIVGIPNMQDARVSEYSPYPSVVAEQLNGRGADYIAFLAKTLKPMIDADFRTLPDASNTGIAGSSMGGLISIYGLLERPDVFGICGALSTAYWFGKCGLCETIQQKSTGYGRLYLDVGGKEGVVIEKLPSSYGYLPGDGTDKNADGRYIDGVRQLRDLLLLHGYSEGPGFRYAEFEGAEHNEPAWAARLPGIMRFLLTGR